jgi:hypothetical protein
VVISVPRATGPTRSTWAAGVVTGTARSTWAAGVIARSARSTWAAGVIARSAGTAGSTWAAGVIARSAGTAGSTWAAGVIAGAARSTRTPGAARATRIIGASGSVDATRRLPAVITRRLWRPGSSVGEPGAHSQRCSAERSGDGHPSDKLLQFHDASPIH